jgi:hypothetical protein
MGLFNSTPDLADDLRAALVGNSRRSRSKVAKVQGTIRDTLTSNESPLIIAVESTSSRVAVVTNERLVLFDGSRSHYTVPANQISGTRLWEIQDYQVAVGIEGTNVKLTFGTYDEANRLAVTIDNRLLATIGPREIPQLRPKYYRDILHRTGKPETDLNLLALADRVAAMIAGGGAMAYFDQAHDSAARQRFMSMFTRERPDAEFILDRPDLMIDYLWDWSPQSHDTLRRLVPRIRELLIAPESFLWTSGDEVPFINE